MTDDTNSYTPIACGTYSEYELAIMRRVSLRLGWLDEQGQQHIGLVQPMDIYSRDRVEYLRVRDINHTQHEIRLDRIISSNVQEAVSR